MATKEILDEVRNRLPIVQRIGEVVQLKKAGRNFKGLCPFHQEKTPSFMVNEEKQIFHCFGCGAGGDIFAFQMKFESQNFPEALETLAKKAGVKIPARTNADPKASAEWEQKKKWGLRLNQIAAEYFQKNLWEKGIGKPVIAYLQQRGLTTETARAHGLGFAENSWDGLLQQLMEKKAPLPLAGELGLIKTGKQAGKYFDFFRNRLIFPIIDPFGGIIAFGGRMLPGASAEEALASGGQAKYLNSPDSFLYHKSKTVYGLGWAKEAIRQTDEVILVEGYMDVIPLRQAGIQNVVAPLGTALTADHLRLLFRYTKNFCLVFDGDTAGQKAAWRALPMFLELGLTPKMISLPAGTDPGSFILAAGKVEWESRKKQSPTLFEAFVSAIAQGEEKNTTGRLKMWGQIAPLLAMVQNPLEQSLYLRQIAAQLGVEESWLKTKRGTSKDLLGGAKPAKGGKRFPEAERLLIAAMLNQPKVLAWVAKEGGPIFTEPTLQKISTQLFSIPADKEDRSFSSLLDGLEVEAEFAAWLREMALKEEPLQWEKIAQDCLAQLRNKGFRGEVTALNTAIAEAERQGKESAVLALLEKKANLIKGRAHDKTDD